jgi:hypothetical protein
VATAVDGVQLMAATIYPVPATTFLYIDLPLVPEDVSVRLFNVSGQELMCNYSLDDALIRMDVAGLKQGSYVVIIAVKDHILQGSFIKQK